MIQRFTREHPCAVCGGWQTLPRGWGVRCYGFLSEDGQWAHCTREEHAGGLEQHMESGTYAHRLTGECKCGETHDDRPSIVLSGLRSIHRARRCAEPVGTVEEYYVYTDPAGQPLHRTVRYRDPKSFRQQHCDDGEWRWGLGSIEPVLYRLPILLSADACVPVFLTEGEKDAERLLELGLVATTHPMGTTWRDHYAAWLRGRHVVICEDNDAAGQKRTAEASRSLRAVAASVRAVRFPHLPIGGDVSDWLDSGGDAQALIERARLHEAMSA